MRAQAQAAQAETVQLRAQVQAQHEHQEAMNRYTKVVAIEASQLPEVNLPTSEDSLRLVYLELFYLLSQWERSGCLPFTPAHLMEQIKNRQGLRACTEALLGTYQAAYTLSRRCVQQQGLRPA